MASTLRLSKSHSAGQGQEGRQGDRLYDGITDRGSSVHSTLILLKLRQQQGRTFGESYLCFVNMILLLNVSLNQSVNPLHITITTPLPSVSLHNKFVSAS